MADDKKQFGIDIVTTAQGNGANETLTGLEKVEQKALTLGQRLRGWGTEILDTAKKVPILGSLIEGLLNPIGLVTAGITAFGIELGKAANMADRLQDLSERFNVDARALQVLGNTAQQSGSSIDGVATALNFLTKTSQDAAAGGKETTAAYERLGISIDEIKSLSADQIFLKVADAVANAGDRNRAYADSLVVMGKGAGDLFATLQKGSAEIIRAGEAFGAFASSEDIARLAEAKDALEALQNKLTVTAGNIVASGMELKAAEEEYGKFGYAALVLQGAISQISGGKINIDIATPIIEATQSAQSATSAVQDLGAAADAVSPEGPKSLADEGLLSVEEAAKSAESAIRDVIAASNQFESAQARLRRAEAEQARSLLDLQLARGEITKEQAANGKANIATDLRAAEFLAEQLKLKRQILETEQELQLLKQAEATADGEVLDNLNTASTAVQDKLDYLNEQLEILGRINEAEASRQTSDNLREVQDILTNEKERLETSKKSSEARKSEVALSKEQLATETAINSALSSRSSAPLQQPGIAPNVDQPVDLMNPGQGLTNFQEMLRQRGNQVGQTTQPPASGQTTPPGATQGPAQSTAAADVTQAFSNANAEIKAVVDALVAGSRQTAETIVSGLKSFEQAETEKGNQEVAAINSAASAALAAADKIIASVKTLEGRLGNIRT